MSKNKRPRKQFLFLMLMHFLGKMMIQMNSLRITNILVNRSVGEKRIQGALTLEGCVHE